MGIEIVRTRDLMKALGFSPQQEAHVLTALSQSGMIVQALFKSKDHPLVFKGGTALNKIHAGFYRLSKDLDFSISVHPKASRTVRSNAAKPLKAFVDRLPKFIPDLAVEKALIGSNGSAQYNAEFSYQSTVAPFPGKIQFEIGLMD